MGSRTLRPCGGLSPLATAMWNKALRRHPSLHMGSKYLFVVGAEDMMMDKNTHNLYTPASPRPVVVVGWG